MEEEKKKCFVIMPISDADGYDKGHFTRVYEHLIKPAVIEAGFEPIRADDTSKANFIVIDILQQILDCDIAICDFSSRNPNVFYELGIRQAFNKRTVLICDKNTIKPFDTSGIRTLDYNSTLRIDEVKKSIPEIAKCIKATYEANANEVNSLLQLLSIERPAMLPEKVTLSQDSSVLLRAMDELNKKIGEISYQTKDRTVLRLDNGNTYYRGQNINEKGKCIGSLSDFGDNFAILTTSDNKKRIYDLQGNAIYQWDPDDLPF